MTDATADPRKGVLLATAAFVLWGLFPMYFYILSDVNAGEILAHRIIWSVVVLFVVLVWLGKLRQLAMELRSPPRLGFYLLTASILSVNWLIYIWATQNERILEASLGYFINPLVTVVLAMLFLNERLRRLQWLAVASATVGVAISVFAYGDVPWVALCLAVSFGTYGLLRKKAAVDPVTSLFAETLVVAPFALLWLAYLHDISQLSFMQGALTRDVLLMLLGFVTVMPLALWLFSLPHLRLITIGLLQYLAPSIQFAVGLWLGETVTTAKLLTFGFIWLALMIYTVDGLASEKKAAPNHRA